MFAAETLHNLPLLFTGEAHQRLIPLHLDLEDFNSIKQFVSDFHALNLPLHLLVNNAGIHLKPFKRVSLDFERTMAVDYFGPFWLTQMLLPDLKANAPSRYAAQMMMVLIVEAFYLTC
eukprot:GHRR01008454.1.p1 GENE.GHRR01008454.1~~GHRR01008454.1.p1  ORF type:complete len:118 (-),score=22.29 GHRR01008454.1:1428-1781(-)